MVRAAFAGLIAALALAQPAAAASLPSVSSGERPGPPLLYEPPPNVPELSVAAPFSAKPLLVSGTDAYRDGEYLYQDYLYDDRGADTVPGFGSRLNSSGSLLVAPTGGDVFYPEDPRYANNAADIVELRIKPTPDAIVYRVTLGAVKDDDATVVGIGMDTDRSGGTPVAWPRGAGVSSPGLDRFVTAWGTGGELTRLSGAGAPSSTSLPAGAVTIDRTTNQMTIRVPRSLMDPGAGTWRHVAGAGLWTGSGWMAVERGLAPRRDVPVSGDPAEGAPAAFNLAFRFDEPQNFNVGLPPAPYETAGSRGQWLEDKQARHLKAARTDCGFADAPSPCRGLHADVDFGRLATGGDADVHPPGRKQARILASRQKIPEGNFPEEFPEFGGRLQPYTMVLPKGYRRDRPAGLTFALHSLGSNYNQYVVVSPNQVRQFGDQRGDIHVTPLARGTSGYYRAESEVDVFEVWADVARHFALDSESVALTGYSMGGYGSYKLGAQYPDLFGKAFPGGAPVGEPTSVPPLPPPEGNDTLVAPLLENVRWIPYLIWHEIADEQAPYLGARAVEARMAALGLRHALWGFARSVRVTPHLTPPITDEWDAARDFLGDARVKRDPSRVDYAFLPADDRPALGLVHDHAYWVSDLRVRDGGGDSDVDPARGEVSARSLAFGEGDPVTRRIFSIGDEQGPPAPAIVEGTAWSRIPRVPAENALEVRLENVRAGTIAGRRAKLSGDEPLRVKLTSDGAGNLRLSLPLPAGASVERVEGPPVAGVSSSAVRAAQSDSRANAPEVALSRSGARFTIAAGARTYVIRPAAAGSAPADDEPGDRDQSAGAGTGEGDAASATGGSGGGGSLPVTGLGLALLVVLAALLLTGGVGLRAGQSRY